MNLKYFAATTAALFAAFGASPSLAQRALGLDVSYYQGNIAQSTWDSLYNVDNRQFVFIRATRGGTTGEDHRQGGYPDSYFNLSERYDDPYFVQNITRATAAGLMAGSYHFARLDVVAGTPNSGGIANTGTDEANHFIEMAGAWMRPGYLMPTFDLETGQSLRTSNDIAQFSIDFSNRIYAVMGIRPAIYVSGNYSNVLQGASSSLRAQLAQPTTLQPGVVGPAYSMLWNPRYATNPNIQTNNPSDTASTFYGPWDDYGDYQPWDFWQYSSSGSVTGISPVDLNVSHGDIEYVKDFLVPAVWMNDSSGDWSALSNWNSGQPAVAPVVAPGQLPAVATGPLPTPRLPGAAGPAITDGHNDTVILERPNADITVTISSGDHNVRKLYMREALNITGGSLTVNYDPEYAVPTDEYGYPLYPYALRSGPVSAQFSGPVTLSGTGQLHVNTLQIDAGQTFTVAGGTLSFRQINLAAGFPAARIVLATNLDVAPVAGGVASVTGDYGYYGQVDLAGGSRTINVPANTELVLGTQITNGALIKAGPGTMRISGYYNDYAGGTTVTGGTLIANSNLGTGDVTVSGPGARLAGYGIAYGNLAVNNGGTVAPGDGHGNFSVDGDVAFNTGSTFEYEFDPFNFANDMLQVGGNLALTGNPSLDIVTPGNHILPRNTRVTLINYAGGWNGGSFAAYPNNGIVSLGGNQVRIRYDDNPDNTQNGGYFPHAVTLTVLTGPVSGFVDEYAPGNWTLDDSLAHGGFVYTGNAPYSLTIYGPEDRSRQHGEIGYSIAVAGDGELSFDWSYSSYDLPGYDFSYFINGVEFPLAGTDGEYGHVNVAVSAGDVIGWRITSTDSTGGQGILYISNFLAPGVPVVIPEPAGIACAAVATAMLELRRSRRRRTIAREHFAEE